MKVITSFTLNWDLETIAEESFEYHGPVALCKGGGSTTVVNTPAPQTPAQLEADRLRLLEMQRQNSLAEAMLPGQLGLIEQQRLILQYQLDHQGDLDAIHSEQLHLAQLQVQEQINNAAMQQELRPQQLQFLQNQNALSLQQIDSLRQTTTFQNEANRYILEGLQDQSRRLAARNAAYSPAEEAQAAAEEARRATRMSAMSEQAANIQLENLKRGTKPTDEQLANINEAYDATQARGESDINRYLTQTLRTINEEQSQASGLRPTDTPVVRLSERAGEEAARAQGNLTESVAGGRAMARLNYPLAASQLTGNQAATLQTISGNAANFQDQLRLAAASNRTQTFNMPGSVGFAMPQQSPTPSLNFMNPGGMTTNPGAFGMQIGVPQGGTTTTNQQVPWWTALGQGAQAIGSVANGIGSVMSAGSQIFSDRRLKDDVKRIGELDSGLSVYSFRYKGEVTPRIGVMAQETARLFPEAVGMHPSGYLTVDHARIH